MSSIVKSTFLLLIIIETIWSKSINLYQRQTTCVIDYNGQKLLEGDAIEINGKFYKVEDCALHRAYHACGTQIIYIVNLVCQAVEQNKLKSHRTRFTRFAQQKLLTEACCQSLCTVSEMTRYCP